MKTIYHILYSLPLPFLMLKPSPNMKQFYTLILFTICFSLLAQHRGASPLPSDMTGKSGDTYALVVGISDYQDENIPDLRFADKDAEAFAGFLQSPAGGSLDEDHLKVLLNEKATVAQFAGALDWLWEVAEENDRVIIYFSGHGDVEKKSITQPGYLLFWDAPSRVYMAGGAFNVRDMQDVVSTLSVQNKAKVILITDACRAGKLSGSGIGGSQATAANLAKQYTNEIKILSCQPDEYSIEGEQWGGGRGAFSYHLVDGLYGLADRNADKVVSLMELRGYLEENVSAEVAPENQLPLTVGNGREKLTVVFPEILAQLKEQRKGQLPMFATTEQKGIEDDVLAAADSNVVALYSAFKKSLKDRHFFLPKNDCADTYYKDLINEPSLERLHTSMRRNYAAALQDDAQQVINSILKTDINEMVLGTTMKAKIQKYAPYPTLLERAAELLGEQHYMYPVLMARSAFFKGYLVKLKNYRSDFSIPNKEVLSEALVHFRTALELQPDFPHVFLEMSEVFKYYDKDSSEVYLKKAIESAPNWLLPYVYWFNFTKRVDRDSSKAILEKALAIDSTSTMIIFSLANFYKENNHLVESEYYFKKLLERGDANVCYSCVHNNLGMVYSDFNYYEKAEEQFQKAMELDPEYPMPYVNMGQLLNVQGRYKEAEPILLKAIEMDSTNWSVHQYLANNYAFTDRHGLAEKEFELALKYSPHPFDVYYDFAVYKARMGRLEESEGLYFKAIALDSTDVRPFINLASMYIDTKRYNMAEQKLQKAIQLDSNHMFVYANLFSVYQSAERYEEAEKMILKAINISPNFIGFRNALGEFYLNRDRNENAKNIFEEEIEKAPGFPNPYIGLSKALVRLDNLEKAWEYLEMGCQKGFANFQDIQSIPEFEELKKKEAKWDDLKKKYFPEQHKD